MNKGICTVSLAALRLEPSHRAEMTSQLLYGESVDILANEGKFLKVKMLKKNILEQKSLKTGNLIIQEVISQMEVLANK